jgi:hypothetical protein
MTYVGLDLHKRYITACALDASGTVVAEERKLMPELAGAHQLALAPPGGARG